MPLLSLAPLRVKPAREKRGERACSHMGHPRPAWAGPSRHRIGLRITLRRPFDICLGQRMV